MTPYKVTPEEMFRLVTAFSAIRDPKIRAEFLSSIGAGRKLSGMQRGEMIKRLFFPNSRL